MPTRTAASPSDRTTWVLDLREIFDGNAVNQTGPDGMRVTSATASATVMGHRVEAQRRSMRGRKGTCIRLSSPDGQTLDLIGWLANSTTNAAEPVGTTLSRSISSVFSDRFATSTSPDKAAEVARRISTVIEVGHQCLHQSIAGSRAMALIQTAAEDIPPAIYRDWAHAYPDFNHSASATSPRPCSIPARQIAWLMNAGFTPQAARDWFGDRITTRKGDVDGCAALRDHGWTREQARQVMDDHFDAAKWKSWASVGPEHYRLAFRAGLTPTAAKRLLRRGEWDERALETLAALRN